MSHSLSQCFKVSSKGLKSKRMALLAMTLILVSLIGGLYLAQTSQIAAVSYRIRELRGEKARLERENAHLLSQTAELKAHSRLLERAEGLGFVPPERIEYVMVPYHPTPVSPMTVEEKPAVASEGGVRHRLGDLFSQFALRLRSFVSR
ncbi:MAG: hypothetical protein U9R11_02915 [Chloroflexota bacterium]|nr:hypothetical protein [Chloroflexota bacterium]